MAVDTIARGMAASVQIDAAVFKYRGTVSTYSDLPSSAEIGDVYNIANADPSHDINAGDNVAWDGEGWDKLGGDVDLSNYLAKDNTTPFVPTGDYNPAVKKYVDEGLANLARDYEIFYVIGNDITAAMNTKGVEILDALLAGKQVLIAYYNSSTSVYFRGFTVINNFTSTSETTGTFYLNLLAPALNVSRTTATTAMSFASYSGSGSYTVSGSGGSRTVTFNISMGTSGNDVMFLSAKNDGSDSTGYFRPSYWTQPVSKGYLQQVANIPYVITEDATEGFFTEANQTVLRNLSRYIVTMKSYQSNVEIVSPVIYLKYFNKNADGSDATTLTTSVLHFNKMEAKSGSILGYTSCYELYFYSDQKLAYVSKNPNSNSSAVAEGCVYFHYYYSLGSDVILPGTSTASNVNTYKPNKGFSSYGQRTVRVLDTTTDYLKPYYPQYDGSPTSKYYVDDKINNLGSDKIVRYYGHVQNSLPAPGTRSGNVITPVYTITQDLISSFNYRTGSDVYSTVANLGKKYFFGVYFHKGTSVANLRSASCVVSTDYPEIIDGVAFSKSTAQPDYILLHVNASASKPAKFSRGRFYDTGSKTDASDFSVYTTDAGVDVASNDITEPSWVALPIVDYRYSSATSIDYSALYSNLLDVIKMKDCTLSRIPKSMLNGVYTYDDTNIAKTITDNITGGVNFNYNVGMGLFKANIAGAIEFVTFNYTVLDNAVYSLGDKNALYVLDKDAFESGSNNYWVQLSKPDNSAALDNIAPAYDNTSTYAEGDYVIYNEALYVCNTDILVAEDFDPTKWTQTTVAELLGNIKSLLGGI